MTLCSPAFQNKWFIHTITFVNTLNMCIIGNKSVSYRCQCDISIFGQIPIIYLEEGQKETERVRVVSPSSPALIL